MTKTWSALLAACGCGLVVAGGLISGCGGGSNAGAAASSPVVTRDAPAQLFGTWKLVRTSGGIVGNGYPVTPGMETLTFSQNGVFVRTVSGQETRGTYQVVRRKTIFSQSHLPVVIYSTTSLTDAISEVGEVPLVLSEEAADGYVRNYERVATGE